MELPSPDGWDGGYTTNNQHSFYIYGGGYADLKVPLLPTAVVAFSLLLIHLLLLKKSIHTNSK